MDFLMAGLFARCDLQKRHILKPPGKHQELCLIELLHVPGEEPRERLARAISCSRRGIYLPLR